MWFFGKFCENLGIIFLPFEKYTPITVKALFHHDTNHVKKNLRYWSTQSKQRNATKWLQAQTILVKQALKHNVADKHNNKLGMDWHNIRSVWLNFDKEKPIRSGRLVCAMPNLSPSLNITNQDSANTCVEFLFWKTYKVFFLFKIINQNFKKKSL